jgi:hypothetical protein
LFDSVPANTVVVVFSDHGEAFLEHGWTQHGVTLYEEEVRVALVVSGPGIVPEGKVVDQPVMLLDVAPTILDLCGVAAPPHYEGADLRPLWNGGKLAQRFIVSETKWGVEGQVLKMAALGEWKLIGSLFDGRQELYRLPDEKTDRRKAEPDVAKVLGEVMHRWLAEEEFWIVYAHGTGRFAGSFTTEGQQNWIPIPLDQEEIVDRFPSAEEGRSFQWLSMPNGGTRALFLQLIPREARTTFNFTIDGRPAGQKVFIGPRGTHPASLPGPIGRHEADSGPFTGTPLHPEAPGFYVRLHRPAGGSSRAVKGIELDDATRRQLRTLGYLQ